MEAFVIVGKQAIDDVCKHEGFFNWIVDGNKARSYPAWRPSPPENEGRHDTRPGHGLHGTLRCATRNFRKLFLIYQRITS
ncbi:hypothetical protein HMPREF9080_00301 [Cardiobacterium valvarum F0432]|uniref:Uncharacterized protein n=1 Tax=Cardiobacterium valvarum F0432 TaxID=797473 RepID=G9ZC25_9GAMM|nr:hypothetical protein HMPREF9080_00301 [Cardiobacterium valvarum F0432]